MKKDAYYFPHFCNAIRDEKITKLRRVFGMEGYGLYFALLETLREKEGFKLPLSSLEDFAYDWHVSKEKICSVVADFGLFQIIDDSFFSPKLIEFLQPYLEGKEKKRIGGIKGNLIKTKTISKSQADKMTPEELDSLDKKRKEGGIVLLTSQTEEVTETHRESHRESHTETHTETHREKIPLRSASQKKVKESKVKESKVKESKEDNPLNFFFRNFDNSLSVIDKEYFSHNYQEVIYSVKTIHGISSDDVNNYIQSFFLNKASYEFENENHVKSSFRKFVEIEREKNLDISKNEYKPRKLKRLEE